MLPTWSGLLLLLAIVVGGGTLLMHGWAVFLSQNRPVGHGVLVVEGWVPKDSLQAAAQLARSGAYDVVVVSGGPIEDLLKDCGFSTYAERAAFGLKQLGVDPAKVIVAAAPASAQDRTYRSSVSVRQALEKAKYKVIALDVFSSGPHARRSRNLYQMAFGDAVKVGVIAAASTSYDMTHWWRTSAGVKEVLAETVAYLWTQCCFHPGVRGSWEEAWGPRN